MKALSLSEFCQQTSPVYIETYMKSLGLEYVYYTHNHYRDNVLTYTEYLNQQFASTMIVEKFKGWNYNWHTGQYSLDYNDTDKVILIDFPDKEVMFLDTIDILGKMKKYRFLIPRTLSDFINDCQRAGIELEFKEQ